MIALKQSVWRRSWAVGFVLAACAFSCPCVWGGETDIIKALASKEATVTETNGVVTKVTVKDCSKWTNVDYQQLGTLTLVKSLSFSAGPNDEGLAQLTALGELETLSTNLMSVTDDGLKQLLRFKKLSSVAFFHPPKEFTGKGLAQLTALPGLERLTVAGSFAFGDQGLAAVGKLTQLKELRTWHAGWTNEGVKELKNLKNLKSLFLGQRLTYKGPPSPSDETIGILAEIPSLESLQLEEARLSLKALCQLKQLPKLKKLSLGGIDIAQADVERLRAELPGVDVKWTPPSDVYQKRIKALFDAK